MLPAQAHATVSDDGYNGMVHIDTVGGSSGTEKGVNGTYSNPSDNLADAYIIAGNENITSFEIRPGSALTLPSDSSKKTFEGTSYTVALNGQELGDGRVTGSISVTGTAINTSGGQIPVFDRCAMGAVTLPPSAFLGCGFFGALTLGSEGNFTLSEGASVFDLPFSIDYGSGLNASKVFLIEWRSGDVEIQNAGAGTGSYVFDMSGTGSVTVNANCSATTTVTLEGLITRNADVTGITYVETGNVIDVLGPAGAGLTDLGGMSTGMKAEVNAEALDVLNTDTHAEPGQELPASTTTLADKINYLYKAWRNKSTQTATTYSLYDDAGSTVDQKATVSDDATTATKGEVATGP